jgi:hypothetical protein
MILNPICATEEKAIIFFISVVCKQVNPIKEALPIATIQINLDSSAELIKGVRRTIPKPPNLRRMPAKIIDP